ncbi:MAG: glycosyltransferase [Actinomycetota bacterium]|nr:glycosyltransferase [Actinomycetota bacterium]
MKVAIFCHSLVSGWNHGNAHFLRGIVTELQDRGHSVSVFEPRDNWSRTNLVRDKGAGAVARFEAKFPALRSEAYDLDNLDLAATLDDVDLVLVHEWNEPELVRRVGAHRASRPGLRVLFHDTHHRAVTAPEQMQRFDLSYYDGVLAFGEVIRQIYAERGWSERTWTWHEAADTTVFKPTPGVDLEQDVVWIGNWGDDERTEELYEFLLGPLGDLGLSATIYGVRYPAAARAEVAAVGAEYRGWLPNYEVPRAFAASSLTVHVPRRPYVRALPGIPTIRVFEALACGIPLICSPWDDAEHLFKPGEDYLVAHNRQQMTRHMKEILNEPELAAYLRRSGLERIAQRHTCAHRVDELLRVCTEIGVAS